jgi:hypothetical protein
MLAILISRAKNNGQFRGLVHNLVDDGLSILHYANDTILFLEDNLEESKNLNLVLGAFEKLLGSCFYSTCRLVLLAISIHLRMWRLECFYSLIWKNEPNNFVKSNSRDDESVVETMHKPSTQKVTPAKLVKKFALKIFTIELAHEFGPLPRKPSYISPHFPQKNKVHPTSRKCSRRESSTISLKTTPHMPFSSGD